MLYPITVARARSHHERCRRFTSLLQLLVSPIYLVALLSRSSESTRSTTSLSTSCAQIIRLADDAAGGEQGHRASECPQKQSGPVCYSCGQAGHISRDCPTPGQVCYRCSKPGHIARDCPESGALPSGPAGGRAGTECYKCGQKGHIAKECGMGGGFGKGGGGFGGGYGGGGQQCYSCGGYGHMSRDCTMGQKCYNCG